MPQRAYILHARSYLDDSLLLNCLTEEDGRIVLVAKRARSAKSRWRGLLQPFQGLWLEWRGRGQVMTLTQAEGMGQAYFLKGSTLVTALYINELVDRLLQKTEAEPYVFLLYGNLLRELHQNANLEQTIRSFELALLKAVGYGLPLTYHVASGEGVLAEAYYRFHWQHGATRMPNQKAPQSDWVSGQTLLAMANNDWSLKETLMEAKKLMRLIFKDIFENRALQSHQVFAMID